MPSYGLCPVCKQPSRLTPKRGVVATHTMGANRCAGVGLRPFADVVTESIAELPRLKVPDGVPECASVAAATEGSQPHSRVSRSKPTGTVRPTPVSKRPESSPSSSEPTGRDWLIFVAFCLLLLSAIGVLPFTWVRDKMATDAKIRDDVAAICADYRAAAAATTHRLAKGPGVLPADDYGLLPTAEWHERVEDSCPDATAAWAARLQKILPVLSDDECDSLALGMPTGTRGKQVAAFYNQCGTGGQYAGMDPSP